MEHCRQGQELYPSQTALAEKVIGIGRYEKRAAGKNLYCFSAPYARNCRCETVIPLTTLVIGASG
jgi:hypothetical protein